MIYNPETNEYTFRTIKEFELPSYMGPYHTFSEPSFDEGYSMNVMDEFGNSISING